MCSSDYIFYLKHISKNIVIYANLKNIHTCILYISKIELGKNIKVKKLSQMEYYLLYILLFIICSYRQ